MRVGITLANQDQWAFAEVAFAYAAQTYEPYAEALAYLGLARDHQGKDGSASVLRAVMLEPENPRVRFLQGLHLRAAGNNRAAIDALAQAAALDPQNPAYYAELAQAYRAEGSLGRAEQLLLTAVGLAGSDTRYLEMLALFYADEAQSLTGDGFSTLEGLTSMLSSDADVQAGYGWAVFITGDTERGLSVIEQVLSVEPENARARYYKALILLEQGARDEAAALLRQLASGSSEFADEASITLRSVGN
jgi:Flp pilus assembly protein TadD